MDGVDGERDRGVMVGETNLIISKSATIAICKCTQVVPRVDVYNAFNPMTGTSFRMSQSVVDEYYIALELPEHVIELIRSQLEQIYTADESTQQCCGDNDDTIANCDCSGSCCVAEAGE